MTSCKLFHSPVTSFDLSREGEFEISLAQGNFLEYFEEKGTSRGKKGYKEEKGRGMGKEMAWKGKAKHIDL